MPSGMESSQILKINLLFRLFLNNTSLCPQAWDSTRSSRAPHKQSGIKVICGESSPSLPWQTARQGSWERW